MTRRIFGVAAAALASVVALVAWEAGRGTGTPQAGSNTATAKAPVANAPVLAAAVATPGPPPIERAPYDPRLAAQTVAAWQDRVRYDPQSGVNLAYLADAYLTLQRQTGDVADAMRAEQAARMALKVFPNNADARHHLSRSLLTQHRFPEAVAVLKNTSPEDSDAQRLKVDLFISLGDYASAQHALGLSPPEHVDPNYFAQRSRLLDVYGHPQRALADVRTARILAESSEDASPEGLAWYFGQEARILAAMGRDEEATQQMKRAIAVFPRDYRALNFLGHLAANRGDWRGAVDWARQASALIPEPDSVTLLGDAYQALGQQKAASQQFALVEAIARLSRAKGMVYDRQRALFYVNHNRHLQEALTLARGETKLRHDIYTYDTLAWVSYKNGLLAPARQAAARALAFNTQDATLWYHAGMIAYASGHAQEAQRDLRKALAINPRFLPTAPSQARALLSKLARTPASPASAAHTTPGTTSAGQVRAASPATM